MTDEGIMLVFFFLSCVTVTDLRSEIEDATGIVITENEIELPDGKPATETLSNLVEFLIETGYLTTSDLPIKSGWRRYLLNSEPVHQSGDEMTRPKEVMPGVFLERNYNKEGIKRKVRNLYRISKPNESKSPK